jgi:hypothetical protein
MCKAESPLCCAMLLACVDAHDCVKSKETCLLFKTPPISVRFTLAIGCLIADKGMGMTMVTLAHRLLWLS